MILDCRPIANRILDSLKAQPKPKKALAGIVVTYNLTSASFLTQKEKTAHLLGVPFIRKRFAVGIPEQFVAAEIDRLSQDENVGGIILQLPFPEEYDRDALIARVPAEKDVDALNGEMRVFPPAVGALETILKEITFDLRSAHVVVVGAGLLVGKPIARYLEGKAKKISVMNKETFAREKLKEADLIIAGAGVPELIHGEDIRSGTVCIDFGYGKKDTMLQGDFHASSVAEKAAVLTPVPGGTGPVLVAKLFENFFALNKE
jgi:methylenetetrahydrofolate dehydrogenase (NADP+) / methenyltetrahydrofolate cyclohydrolase